MNKLMGVFLLLATLLATSTAKAAEVEVNVGDSLTRVVCSDHDGEMVISKVGKSVMKITLIDGYSWGCRYGDKTTFYDLSMPPVGMVGGVVVIVDTKF